MDLLAVVADDAEVVACNGMELKADVEVSASKENKESVHLFDCGGRYVDAKKSVPITFVPMDIDAMVLSNESPSKKKVWK